MYEKVHCPEQNLRMVLIPERGLNIKRAIDRWDGLDVIHQEEKAMILPAQLVFFTIADDCMRHSPKATFSVKQETVWQRFESS